MAIRYCEENPHATPWLRYSRTYMGFEIFNDVFNKANGFSLVFVRGTNIVLDIMPNNEIDAQCALIDAKIALNKCMRQIFKNINNTK